MAWLQLTRRKDGTRTWWIRDRRNDGMQVSIPAGSRKSEADIKREQYEIRQDLEKDGYDDEYAKDLEVRSW